MALLIAGVVLWSALHFLPSLAPDGRAKIIASLGDKAYRGLFALGIVAALLLIVTGWGSANVAPLYAPPLPGSPIVTVLVLIAFVLLASANAPTNIRRFIRHPMLTGVIVWGVAHLLANGEIRSVLLFGGMSAWAVLSIIFISRRDGKWQKPQPLPFSKDVITIIISATVFAAVLFFHKTFFGVAPIPGL